MTANEAAGLIQEFARPADTQPTGESPGLKSLPGIRAVVFDVYGTLFMSSSGDIGLLADDATADEAMASALQAEGIVTTPSMQLAQRLKRKIHREHARRRLAGTPYPEVEIRKLWAELLREHDLTLDPEAIERVAIRHEILVNPVWPFPDTLQTLATFRDRGVPMGIVSNAQFYTPPLFEGLLKHSLQELGFQQDLCFWSYEVGESKPSPELFTRLTQALEERKISPQETLFIGNDMLKDIAPAAAAGFRTALFAGDARSLRWRREDDLDAEPDVILTELAQLPECVPSS